MVSAANIPFKKKKLLFSTFLSCAGNSDRLTYYLGKEQQPQEQRYPFLPECVVISFVQARYMAASVWDVYVRTNTDACDCIQGLYERCKRVCTGCRLWEKNPFPHRGLEPASVLRLAFQSDALPAELSTPVRRKHDDDVTFKSVTN